jgi:hypothetical protein
MSFKKQLKSLLKDDHINEVIKSLTVIADQIGDNKMMNEVVQQYTRYQSLQNHPIKVPDNQAISIKNALWHIINRLP